MAVTMSVTTPAVVVLASWLGILGQVVTERSAEVRLIVILLLGVAALSFLTFIIYWWATGRDKRRRFDNRSPAAESERSGR